MSSSVQHADKLVRMANQIAAFFRSFPHDQAVAGVRQHIIDFWSPAMRRDLTQRLDADEAGVDALVVSAMHAPVSAESPLERESAGPADAGQLGASDAG